MPHAQCSQPQAVHTAGGCVLELHGGTHCAQEVPPAYAVEAALAGSTQCLHASATPHSAP